MQSILLTAELYPDWNEACLEMDEAWFWHTTEWLEYTLHYRPNLHPLSSSFMVTNNNRVLAICPLILETHTRPDGNVREFSYGGGPGPAPALANGLSERVRKEVLKVICDEVDAQAHKMSAARVSFRTSPPAPAFWHDGPPKPHPLLRFGFLDIPLATRVIDLSQREDKLLNQMRKGHRHAVKRSQQLLHTEVYDTTNVTEEIYEEYRLLHGRAAGRATRPPETFELMRKWIRNGMAILSIARFDSRVAGCALISVYKDGAYYSSGCEDPDCSNLPVGHALQWAAMRWMKEHGIAHYEIGLQSYGMQPHGMPSEKELNISLFKRGFGGATIILWTGEKFYTREYYREVMHDRVEKFASAAFPAQTAAAV